ncbi:MAG: hypothetical protein AAF740_12440 [Bacteroidota bacterium]
MRFLPFKREEVSLEEIRKDIEKIKVGLDQDAMKSLLESRKALKKLYRESHVVRYIDEYQGVSEDQTIFILGKTLDGKIEYVQKGEYGNKSDVEEFEQRLNYQIDHVFRDTKVFRERDLDWDEMLRKEEQNELFILRNRNRKDWIDYLAGWIGGGPY